MLYSLGFCVSPCVSQHEASEGDGSKAMPHIEKATDDDDDDFPVAQHFSISLVANFDVFRHRRLVVPFKANRR